VHAADGYYVIGGCPKIFIGLPWRAVWFSTGNKRRTICGPCMTAAFIVASQLGSPNTARQSICGFGAGLAN